MTFDNSNPLQDQSEYIKHILNADKEDLEEILCSIKEKEVLSENINDNYDEQLTFGQRIADKVASFGGSWTFIIIFLSVLVVWMAINVMLGTRAWDSYPFILLNLCLSCIAALQAPIIMMSQNRQAARDRLRAENDYKVNLKAEIEIRTLHEKLDHLLMKKWQTLMEIQEIQLNIMQQNFSLSQTKNITTKEE